MLKRWGSHNVLWTQLNLDLYLRGPGDDSVRVETRSPNNHFHVLIKKTDVYD